MHSLVVAKSIIRYIVKSSFVKTRTVCSLPTTFSDRKKGDTRFLAVVLFLWVNEMCSQSFFKVWEQEEEGRKNFFFYDESEIFSVHPEEIGKAKWEREEREKGFAGRLENFHVSEIFRKILRALSENLAERKMVI